MCSFAATSDGFANSLTGMPVFLSSAECQWADDHRMQARSLPIKDLYANLDKPTLTEYMH